jgi:pimeloyl-[acyl-carrier protein] methyl ester esterase
MDLPGHGRSPALSGSTNLEAMARACLAAAPESAIWLGWSLGGMVAMQAALLAPERVQALVLVSTTPRFVAGEDWRAGMALETLDKFAAELRTDFRTTVQHFLTLQVRGDEHAREILRALRQEVFAHGEPTTEALAVGLDILRATDLRARLAGIHQPALVITGGRDRLTPPQSGEAMAGMLPEAQLLSVPDAAHAPFLSHPNRFVRAVEDFAAEVAWSQARQGESL